MDTVTSFKIKSMCPQLIVADLDIAIAFYTGNLGFEVEFFYEDFYAAIVKDGYSVHLKLDTPFAEERKKRRENEHLDLVISVDDIAHVYEEIISQTVDVVQSLREMPYGKEFYIADPDGHIIGFLES